LDFTCVNCSKLTSITFRSDDIIVYKCNDCDMEYRLFGWVEKQSTHEISREGNTMIKESNRNAMPIRVEIKHS
jgi:hypothetical protein